MESMNLRNGTDDNKMNSNFQKLLSQYKKSVDSSGGDVKDIRHDKPVNTSKPDGPMKGNLMTWTEVLESMDEVSNGIDELNDPDAINAPVNEPTSTPPTGNNEDELLNELNQIFTPILVMQGYENSIADKINEAFSEGSLLMENNVISFDSKTRMAQLISVCALLIARQKNSEKYQMYKKAAEIKNKMKVDIQKEEYEAAQVLAQKFLVKVSTTNNSSVARNAANELLPETQH